MDLMIQYALAMMGKSPHYLWGGDDPIKGFDCSGFATEMLKASGVVGRLQPKLSAQQIFDLAERDIWTRPLPAAYTGSFAFFGADVKHIEHIGWCANAFQMIHAASGDSTTTNADRAAQQNAFVRIDLIVYRRDLITVRKPRYAAIGLI